MADERNWKVGDRVRLDARPEWGVGEIVHAGQHVHEGRTCQQLRVRFRSGGLKTLTTALASLREADQAPEHAPHSQRPRGWLEEAESSDPETAIRSLPGALTDPFTPIDTRLREAIGALRFEPHGGSLIEWATWQTGLDDPMTRFTRHELESHFEHFRHALVTHARALVRELRAESPERAFELLAQVPDTIAHLLVSGGARR